MENVEKLISVACTAVIVAALALDQTLPDNVRVALIAAASMCAPRPAELLEKARDAVKAVKLKYSKMRPKTGKGGKGKGK